MAEDGQRWPRMAEDGGNHQKLGELFSKATRRSIALLKP